MALLQDHPTSVRKNIALWITVGVGVLMVLIFILIYTHRRGAGTSEPSSRINNFYNTILDTGQQYFGAK